MAVLSSIASGSFAEIPASVVIDNAPHQAATQRGCNNRMIWFYPVGFAALGVVAAITLYGFRTALGSRRLFEGSGVEG
jgi:hypothetical protein